MIYLELLWVFFIANLLGYGGGPSIIPLIEHETVYVFGWLTEYEFAEVLAMGNALPGPIAPKMAAFIGYAQAGLAGASVAVLATVVPSLVLMLALMGLLTRYKDAPQVKRLTVYIRPTIAVLLADIVVRNFIVAWHGIGWLHLLILGGVSLLCLTKLKVHPALMVAGALVYGALVLG
ncbi:MAG: chromate transporter [Defluviitaleaceae bacterium]|nr:chromate transporter [Defluviitaleaceae bacterium]MCL2273449.1 chromate transporter [Defluviitaleaceae bacterium]